MGSRLRPLQWISYWLLSSCLPVSWSVSPVSHSMLLLCLMGGIIMETLLGSLTLLLRSMFGQVWSKRNSHLEVRLMASGVISEEKNIFWERKKKKKKKKKKK